MSGIIYIFTSNRDKMHNRSGCSPHMGRWESYDMTAAGTQGVVAAVRVSVRHVEPGEIGTYAFCPPAEAIPKELKGASPWTLNARKN